MAIWKTNSFEVQNFTSCEQLFKKNIEIWRVLIDWIFNHKYVNGHHTSQPSLYEVYRVVMRLLDHISTNICSVYPLVLARARQAWLCVMKSETRHMLATSAPGTDTAAPLTAFPSSFILQPMSHVHSSIAKHLQLAAQLNLNHLDTFIESISCKCIFVLSLEVRRQCLHRRGHLVLAW